jgi:hypothetical protein
MGYQVKYELTDKQEATDKDKEALIREWIAATKTAHEAKGDLVVDSFYFPNPGTGKPTQCRGVVIYRQAILV